MRLTEQSDTLCTIRKVYTVLAWQHWKNYDPFFRSKIRILNVGLVLGKCWLNLVLGDFIPKQKNLQFHPHIWEYDDETILFFWASMYSNPWGGYVISVVFLQLDFPLPFILLPFNIQCDYTCRKCEDWFWQMFFHSCNDAELETGFLNWLSILVIDKSLPWLHCIQGSFSLPLA